MTRVVMIPTTASTPFQNLFSFWTAGAAAASIQTLPLASPIQHNIHAYHNTQTPHKYMYRERKREENAYQTVQTQRSEQNRNDDAVLPVKLPENPDRLLKGARIWDQKERVKGYTSHPGDASHWKWASVWENRASRRERKWARLFDFCILKLL